MTDRDNITLPREVVQEALEALAKTPCNSVYEQDCTPCNAEEALRKALAAEQPKPSEDIEALRRDAERYRLLRRGQHWSVVNGIGDALRAEELDALFDAAMKEDKT